MKNMRSLWRTVDQRLIKDVAAMAASATIVGASFGAIAVAAGMPIWLSSAMSLLVFAGGSQFMAVGILAAGGGPVAAVLAGLVLNARHLPFGLAVGEAIGTSWLRRIVGAHLLIDENTAYALAQRDPQRARAAYWACGLAMFVLWNLGTVGGAVVGNAIGDPALLGLDAAFPAGMLALLLPSLRDRPALLSAVVGVTVAVIATPFVTPGLPVLLALVGLLTLLPAKEKVAA
jgi:4-azaleucine resistance transporter AzlC